MYCRSVSQPGLSILSSPLPIRTVPSRPAGIVRAARTDSVGRSVIGQLVKPLNPTHAQLRTVVVVHMSLRQASNKKMANKI